MIPKDYITEWREQAPWVSDAQVEQDLVIGRAIVELFQVEELADRLAFRGGAALSRLGRLVFGAEPVDKREMRLKIEVNSREHFTALGYLHTPFEIDSRWWSGEAQITTFALEEMLGTKLRALYQRRKGRDLFDLWYGLQKGSASADRIVACFERYMHEGGHRVSRALSEENLTNKLADVTFRDDMRPLLRPGVPWDVDQAGAVVMAKLLARLP